MAKTIKKGISDLVCIDNISKIKRNKLKFDNSKKFSYVLRREDFLNELISLKQKYPNTFYIQFQDKKIRKDYAKFNGILDSGYEDNPIKILNKRYYEINQLTKKDIIDNSNRQDMIIYDDSKKISYLEKDYQFKAIWNKRKDDSIDFQLRRLRNPVGPMDEIFYHCIFDQDLETCIHTDSHFFRFDEEGYKQREEGNYMAPIKEKEINGKLMKSKFYHFYSAKEIGFDDSLSLLKKFMNDDRIDHYLEKFQK